MARILYKVVKKSNTQKALNTLKSAKLKGYYTDYKQKKGYIRVYAVARTKKVKGFRAKKEKMSYI